MYFTSFSIKRPLSQTKYLFYERSKTRKNIVFYKLFGRRALWNILKHTQTTYFTSISIDRPIDNTQKQRFLRAFRSTDRSFDRPSDASNALKHAKTSFFTSFSIDRPIANALRAFSNTQKQRILRAFRAFRSSSALKHSQTRKNNVFYELFDRPTDRQHAKTSFFTCFSIDRPIVRSTVGRFERSKTIHQKL